MDEYIKKEDVLVYLEKWKIGHIEDEEHYPINYGTLLDMMFFIRHLQTHSFPDSAEDNTMEWITKNGCFGYSLRCSKCDTEVVNESNFCPNCGRKAVKI